MFSGKKITNSSSSVQEKIAAFEDHNAASVSYSPVNCSSDPPLPCCNRHYLQRLRLGVAGTHSSDRLLIYPVSSHVLIPAVSALEGSSLCQTCVSASHAKCYSSRINKDNVIYFQRYGWGIAFRATPYIVTTSIFIRQRAALL